MLNEMCVCFTSAYQGLKNMYTFEYTCLQDTNWRRDGKLTVQFIDHFTLINQLLIFTVRIF